MGEGWLQKRMHENTLWVVPTTFTQDRKDQRVGEKSNLSLQ